MYQLKKTFLPLSLLAVIVLAACEESIDWQLHPGNNGRLVVEAILTDELKIQEVRLSQTYDELNAPVPVVTDAEVRVVVNGITATFLHVDQEPGLYRSQQPFAVLANLEYVLEVDWRGNSYRAVSELSEVAPLQAIGFQHYGKADSLTFTEFAPVYSPHQQAMYEMQVDWSHLGNSTPNRAKRYFYTFSTLDVGGFVRPTRDTVFFPVGSIVTAKKFGLNDDFAAYLQAQVIETEWRGGPFYSAAAPLPTNLSNGALGFFATCAVVKDTVIAQ